MTALSISKCTGVASVCSTTQPALARPTRSPYRDAHGEADLGLMRGKPLALNEAEYAQLTRQWLALSFQETARTDEGEHW